ncbi:uncharacterized protein EDB91DRAFT_1104286 [Suillus paluster]|uniref:uncharacterized protein n=1 Tax=Suillus paluster TaxID=48578 RepID=UPI001B879CD3|nr:uncharacterized protein EDB91DRAFT_1104286 [Suillus paluster]KAG1751253.1 hypothetical protein EDB91DRAFT_1104286 [Suillus paluster]
MPRGNNNDRGRGFRGSPRGQYRGGSRGRGRGRGRGQFHNDTHGGAYPHTETDFVVQVWQEPPSNYFSRGGSPWRGRGGRGRGSGIRDQRYLNEEEVPRGVEWVLVWVLGGEDGDGESLTAPTGRARPGFGRGQNRNGPNTLDSARYLRPIKFVPSVHTKTLFGEVEEILQPVAESAGMSRKAMFPLQDRVTRVFSGRDLPPPSSSDELEEVDFADMGKLLPRLGKAQASTSARVPQVASSSREEVFTGMYNKNNRNVRPSPRPVSKHTDAKPKKPVFVSTDVVVSKTIATSVHGVTTLEKSAAALVITQDDEIAVDKPETITFSQPPATSISNEITASPARLPKDDTPTFFVDTEPTRHRSASDIVLFDRTPWVGAPLGEEDELIVYVAPHPRSGRASPIPDVPRVRLPLRSVLTGTTNPVQNHSLPQSPVDDKIIPTQSSEPPQFSSVSFGFTSPNVKKQRQRPVFTPGDRSKVRVQARKQEARVVRKRAKRQALFGSFGAILSEARLRDADERERRDVRWESRRKDDSDIDWGDGDDDVLEKDGIDEVSNGLGGMDLDPDLEPNLEAMKGFVQSMSAEGSRHVTMDDIQDEERTKMEDEEEEDDGSDSHGSYNDTSDEEDKEENAVFEVEEEILIAESEDTKPRGPSPSDDSDDGEDSSDDDLSPRANFQSRLHRVREKSRATKPETETPESDSDESSGDDFPRWNRGDADDDYIAQIEDLLEMHSDIASSKNQKLRNKVFRAIHNGQFDHLDDYVELNGSFTYTEMEPAKRKKDKMKELPDDLQEIWEKDRAKKAERKQARKEAHILAAADPFTPKKGGKKGRKAIQIPNAIVDMDSLEEQIRRFIIDDIGGKNNNRMVLPPMDKMSRKQVHELANAFNLKSHSKGKGDRRYITLTKATRTRFADERKVKNVMKRHGGGFDTMPRHKDGDEVGKAAPKIGETNVGFKMLASMGWAEGDRIGSVSSTGIDAPLTAIIKNTKRGLGATR